MKNVAETKNCISEYRPKANMTSQIVPLGLSVNLGSSGRATAIGLQLTKLNLYHFPNFLMLLQT